MKANLFSRIFTIAISLVIFLPLVFLPMAQAQTINVDAAHDFDPEIPGNYQYMQIKIHPNSYFEIVLEIIELGGETLYINFVPDEDERDVEVDGDTMTYYLGDNICDAWSPYNINRDYWEYIEIPGIFALFFEAWDKSNDWDSYDWDFSSTSTCRIVNIRIKTTYNVKIKYIQFYDNANHTGTPHEASQNFSDYDDISNDEADWDNNKSSTGIVSIANDGTIYFRNINTAYYEPPDKDKDGFDEFYDCDDNDATVYPGAPGTHQGKDNNCNGKIDLNEKRQPAYTPFIPSLMPYQQLWRLSSFFPSYIEGRDKVRHQNRMIPYQYFPSYLQLQDKISHQYPIILYQQTMQSKGSEDRSRQFYNQPLWHSYHWYEEKDIDRIRQLSASLSPTIFLSQSYSPFLNPSNYNVDPHYDICLGQYLNSIIHNPFVLQPMDTETSPPLTDYQPEYAQADHMLYYFYNGRSLIAVIGDIISIILESDDTTDYQWYLDEDELDEDVVSHVSRVYYPDRSEQWIFEAQGEGYTTIRIEYRKPGSTTASQTFTIDVEVKGSDNHDTSETDDIPDVTGKWIGSWKAYANNPDPNVGGFLTDPNTGEIFIAATGELVIEITKQNKVAGIDPDMTVEGTLEITGWSAGNPPEWSCTNSENTLTGWVSEYDQFLKCNFTYTEAMQDYIFKWSLGSNLMLNITDTHISGSFSIAGLSTGYQDYYILGTFNAVRVNP